MGEPQYYESINDIVSQRVNHLLFINKMSQRDLALRLGMKANSVNSKMVGRTRWNFEEVIELSDLFQISVEYLAGRMSIESAAPLRAKAKSPTDVGAGLRSTQGRNVAGFSHQHLDGGMQKAPASDEAGALWARRGSNPRPTD